MKKPLLFAATVLLLCTGAHAQTRLVLYEEFTGETCPSCADENPSLDLMMATAPNPTNIHMIKYMCNIPDSGPFYYMTNDLFETTRQDYYDVPFAPFAPLDGSVPDGDIPYPGYPAYLTQSDLDNEAAVASPFTISVSGHYNATNDSITITATVTALVNFAPTGGILKLRTALCKSLTFDAPVANGESEFENVVRNMYPSVDGTSISNTWAAGTVQTYTLTGQVPTEVNASVPHHATDSSVVVWIQNDNDKTIQQAAVSSIGPLGINSLSSVKQFSVFPNPAQTVANISFTAQAAGEADITVTDITGRIVASLPTQNIKTGENKISINTSSLTNGIYNVKLEMNGAVSTHALSIIK